MKVRPVVVALALALLLFGCGGPPAPAEFSSAEGGFSIMMPGDPKNQTQEVPTAAGNVTTSMFVSEFADQAYFVAYADFPEALVGMADPQTLLQGGRDSAMQSMDATIVSEQAITIDGHPGREVLATASIGGVDATVKARFYLVKNRLYQLWVAGAKDKLAEVDMDAFLQSFKLN